VRSSTTSSTSRGGLSSPGNEDVDIILEKTRQRMADVLNVSSQSAGEGIDSLISGKHNIIESPALVSISSRNPMTLNNSNAILGGEAERELGTASHSSLPERPKGILKQIPRYDDKKLNGKTFDHLSAVISTALPAVVGQMPCVESSSKPAEYDTQSEGDAFRHKLERATLAEEMGLIDLEASPQDSPTHNAEESIVRDFVVERSSPKADPYPEPCNTAKESGNGSQSNTNHDCFDVTGAQNKKKGNSDGGNTIEADIEFSYMAEEEYDETMELAKSTGVSHEEILKSKVRFNGIGKGNDMLEDGANESQDVSMSASDEDDDGMMDFFAHEEEEEEEQIGAQPSISPFMVLWNVLAKWITSEGVQILQEWRQDLFHENYIGPVVKESSETQKYSPQNINTSDVSLSRCAGLMSMLKLNTTMALSELGYNYTNKIVESRLGDFIKTFDFEQPMVKLDSDMWAALTTVLLEIILPKNNTKNTDGAKWRPTNSSLPSQLQKVGLTIEEYHYLTCTAIPSMYHCT